MPYMDPMGSGIIKMCRNTAQSYYSKGMAGIANKSSFLDVILNYIRWSQEKMMLKRLLILLRALCWNVFHPSCSQQQDDMRRPIQK